MNRVYAAYIILKIRMKIGYQMALKKMTFLEVWLNAILITYHERLDAGLISNPYPKPKFKLIEELNNCNLIQVFDMI